jgi:hypothetical protein
VAGRVAIATPTGPQIVPVNYTVVDGAVIIRTSPYSMLATHGRDSMFAFEIDCFDRANERGWSVQARGRAEVITERATLDRIREVAEPQPWVTGLRSFYLRMRWTELTGRQVGEYWNPLHDLPVGERV